MPVAQTIREQILVAITAKLKTLATVPKESVYRDRTSPFLREESPAISITWKEEPVQLKSNQIARRDLNVELMIVVRGEEPTKIIDEIINDVHSTVMSDPTFEGIAAQTIGTDSTMEVDSADGDVGELKATYVVTYFTPINDLTKNL